MRAGVCRAFSRRRARYSGLGRHCRYASRTGSGMSISRSVETSCMISDIGKSGARSSVPTGLSVPGCRTGGGGEGRSAVRLYQHFGNRVSSSTAYLTSWFMMAPSSRSSTSWSSRAMLTLGPTTDRLVRPAGGQPQSEAAGVPMSLGFIAGPPLIVSECRTHRERAPVTCAGDGGAFGAVPLLPRG